MTDCTLNVHQPILVQLRPCKMSFSSVADDMDLSGVTSVSSQSPFSSSEDGEKGRRFADRQDRVSISSDDGKAGIKALDEVAQFLELSEYDIGAGFRRDRASTISCSSSYYNDIKPPQKHSLQQYLDEIGDDELIAANLLSNMNQMNAGSDEEWADSGEPSPMYLIRTVEKVTNTNIGSMVGSYTGRARPRSHSVSEISFYKTSTAESGKPYLGSYTPEERRKRIERFLEKRKLRVWTKRVKYDVRKNFADSRVRVRGRFVRKDSAEASDLIMET